MSTKIIDKKKSKDTRLWNLNFSLLWQGQLVSAFGDTVYDIALGFWILAKTGSTGMMGLLMATSVIPRVFISPFSGTFIDRHNRKNIIVLTDFIRGVTITFIGVAALKGFIEIWMVLVGGITLGICGSFFNPAVQSSLPDIVPREKLVKANSAFSLLTTSTGIVGRVAGGFLFQILGAPIMFLINGISFLFSSFTELFVKIPVVKSDNNKVTFLEDMKDGINFIRKSKGLKYLYLTIAFLNFFSSMAMTLLLPLFNNRESLGPKLYGIAMAFSMGGMFLGFLILSVIDIKSLNKFLLFILGGVISALVMVVLPFIPYFSIMIILMFINGFTVAIINAILQSSMQAFVPASMRGKVFGFRRTLSSSLTPLGMAIGGILGEVISIDIIISGSFVIVLVLMSYLAFSIPVKQLINFDS